MENLIFCLNATIPIFFTLLLGYFFRRIGLFDDAFVSRMNKFVFVAALPVPGYCSGRYLQGLGSENGNLLLRDHFFKHYNFRSSVAVSSSVRYPR